MKATEIGAVERPAEPGNQERLGIILGDIEVFGAWIRSSDTKAGLLIAGLGFVITNVFAATRLWAEHPVDLLSKPAVVLVVLGLLVATLLTTFLFLGLTLSPRLKMGKSGENPFSFPSLCSPSAYCQMDYAQLIDSAWEQKVLLAEICGAKYRMFRRGLVAGGVSMLLFVVIWVLW